MLKNLFLGFSILSLSILALGSASAAPVNINQADAKEIARSLNGIGLKKAQAIVAYRDQHGYFTAADQLSLVKGIGEKLVLKIRDDIQLQNVE